MGVEACKMSSRVGLFLILRETRDYPIGVPGELCCGKSSLVPRPKQWFCQAKKRIPKPGPSLKPENPALSANP